MAHQHKIGHSVYFRRRHWKQYLLLQQRLL